MYKNTNQELSNVLFYILGASGFVGKHLACALESEGHEVFRLSRPDFDYLRHGSYQKLDFTGTTIVDCITAVDGTPEFIRRTVVGGLSNFIKKPSVKRAKRYVYLSTSATLLPEIIKKNCYVASKFEAEGIVRQMPNAQIVRLTFPFGFGEKSQRLVSRLICMALKGEPIMVGNIVMPLTPIGFLGARFSEVVMNQRREINFTDGKVYKLEQVVKTIFKTMGLNESYSLDMGNFTDFTLAEPHCFDNQIGALDLVRRMAEERLNHPNRAGER